MFLTNILLKKVKSKNVLVLVESVVSGHLHHKVRERTADKVEVVLFDPLIRQNVVYREKKKLHGI